MLAIRYLRMIFTSYLNGIFEHLNSYSRHTATPPLIDSYRHPVVLGIVFTSVVFLMIIVKAVGHSLTHKTLTVEKALPAMSHQSDTDTVIKDVKKN